MASAEMGFFFFFFLQQVPEYEKKTSFGLGLEQGWQTLPIKS